jgi:hypothetical protein
MRRLATIAYAQAGLLAVVLAASTARATNWHCYYTNCLFAFVPPVINGATVTAAQVELEFLRRAERFGSITNTTAAGRQTQTLAPGPNGFSTHVYFGAQQHRLWEPFDAGVIVTLVAHCGTNAMMRTREVVYFTQRGGIVRACGPPSTADRVEDRAAEATHQLQTAVQQHAGAARTNTVLFIAQWGYVS